MTRRAAAALAALALAGCSSMSMNAMTERTVLREVMDQTVTSTSTLSRVAVVAVERDPSARKAWEEAFATRLGARGVTASPGTGLLAGAGNDADAIVVDGGPVIAAARQAGADAILFITPPGAVPVRGSGAYRWFDARSGPDPRTDLDTAATSVTEVRLYSLKTDKGVWRASVMRYYPKPGAADAGDIADATVAGLAKRQYLR
jgi:hypothetical protein